MNIHYWNFKERFQKIDTVTEELNPIINNNSIAKYIEKSFQVDAEEVAVHVSLNDFYLGVLISVTLLVILRLTFILDLLMRSCKWKGPIRSSAKFLTVWIYNYLSFLVLVFEVGEHFDNTCLHTTVGVSDETSRH